MSARRPSPQGSARGADAARSFVEARDFLLAQRTDYATAYAAFRWPRPEQFNWALDYFEPLAHGNPRTALWIVDEGGEETRLTFHELNERSNRVASFLRQQGVRRGSRLLLMLPNVAALWEVTLAAMKLGAVVSPATLLLSPADIADRIERGGLSHVVADAGCVDKFVDMPGVYRRIAVGRPVAGWEPYAAAAQATAEPMADGRTLSSDPLLLYFTSGTTARPKIVLHTHASYAIGHLSTMYWIGLRAGDVHLNISSPGWAKHAWSSFFAPWNAGATVFVYNAARFDAKKALAVIARCGVTTLCAPPTVWRTLILEDLTAFPVKLRELVGAGEPLNPEIIERVRAAWGLTIRDGYGQTETTCQVGNPPGRPVKPGSMGVPMPGYRMALLDADGVESDEGELAIGLDPAPVGLMRGYLDRPELTAPLLQGSHYRTSDVARRDADGSFWYIGRTDDVFKSSDYRVSPFELESALLECAVVAEAAVVPSPDALRLAVPKAYVALKPGQPPTRDTALRIFGDLRGRLAPYQRIRRIEFADLPKTVSGKIRRVELRAQEQLRRSRNERGTHEYWEEDFAELRASGAAQEARR